MILCSETLSFSESCSYHEFVGYCKQNNKKSNTKEELRIQKLRVIVDMLF